jgi:alkaline phosphatase
VISTLVAALLFASTPAVPQPRPAAPKNIILFIADGAGSGHYTIARHLRKENFRIGTMPVIGLSSTFCANRTVTDSAAGASALATGIKTNYEMVSLDPQTLKPVETVLERAEANGKATGLVSTAYFWDATLSAFAAHANHRHDPGVREQMMEKGIEVLAGGGLESFGKDPLPAFDAYASQYGYTPIDTRQELDAAKGTRLLVSFPSRDRNADFAEARLADLTAFAIRHLEADPDGFFLMVEHEGTDGASHQNNEADARAAMISFDEAVGVALDFASKRTDTLVVVTSDHETGGLRISETRNLARPRLEWSTSDHTAAIVPIFAFGPQAGAFAKFQENTDVGRTLLQFVSKP